MKKRLLALLLLTGLLSAALTGCGGGSTEQASEDGQTADGSTEARAQANEIVVGMNAQDAIERMKGIHCGPKPTSCPDQMAHALEEALAAERA